MLNYIYVIFLCQPHDLGREGTENYCVEGQFLLIYRFLKISHQRYISCTANLNLLILACTDASEVIHVSSGVQEPQAEVSETIITRFLCC